MVEKKDKDNDSDSEIYDNLLPTKEGLELLADEGIVLDKIKPAVEISPSENVNEASNSASETKEQKALEKEGREKERREKEIEQIKRIQLKAMLTVPGFVPAQLIRLDNQVFPGDPDPNVASLSTALPALRKLYQGFYEVKGHVGGNGKPLILEVKQTADGAYLSLVNPPDPSTNPQGFINAHKEIYRAYALNSGEDKLTLSFQQAKENYEMIDPLRIALMLEAATAPPYIEVTLSLEIRSKMTSMVKQGMTDQVVAIENKLADINAKYREHVAGRPEKMAVEKAAMFHGEMIEKMEKSFKEVKDAKAEIEALTKPVSGVVTTGKTPEEKEKLEEKLTLKITELNAVLSEAETKVDSKEPGEVVSEKTLASYEKTVATIKREAAKLNVLGEINPGLDKLTGKVDLKANPIASHSSKGMSSR